MSQLQPHPLHAMVDTAVSVSAGWVPIDLAHAFLDGGARLIQLRAKEMASGALLATSDALVRLADQYEAAVIVNDRVDVARLSSAAGVHVGQDDLAPAAARTQLGPAAIVGYSTHTLAQIDAAVLEPISYLAVGPVFGTSTKDTGYNAVGLDLVSAAVRRAGGVPIVAIGGVTLDTARSAIEAGAAAVAVISDLLRGGDPEARVKAYLRALS